MKPELRAVPDRIRVKKNDVVQVISGKERGKRGKILKVFPAKGRVLIEKLNMIKRHQRPTQRIRQGGIIEKEAPIHVSKVQIVCAKCDRGVRIKHRILQDGKKVRVCGKCGEVLDV
jgi:large subunit ribosomal protein L24